MYLYNFSNRQIHDYSRQWPSPYLLWIRFSCEFVYITRRLVSRENSRRRRRRRAYVRAQAVMPLCPTLKYSTQLNSTQRTTHQSEWLTRGKSWKLARCAPVRMPWPTTTISVILHEEDCLLFCKTRQDVRSHLEYANSVWNPHRLGLIKDLEKVQMRATKLVIISIKNFYL